MNAQLPPPLPAAEVELRGGRSDRRPFQVYQLCLLAVAAGILVVAWLLEVQPDQRVAFTFAPDRPLPHVCVSRALLGWDCPGCGLTRSLIHFSHGRIENSLRAHPLGLAIGMLLVAQLPYRMWQLIWGREHRLRPAIPLAVLACLAAVMWIQWGIRIAAR